jgi:hypothetical protein
LGIFLSATAPKEVEKEIRPVLVHTAGEIWNGTWEVLRFLHAVDEGPHVHVVCQGFDIRMLLKHGRKSMP